LISVILQKSLYWIYNFGTKIMMLSLKSSFTISIVSRDVLIAICYEQENV